MYKLFSKILCLTLLTLLAACGGGGTSTTGTNSTVAKGVSFSFSKDALVSAKTSGKSLSASVPTTLDPTARYASITATDAGGNTVLNNYKTDIYALNGSYVTATIALPAGDYKVTQFFVLDSNNNVLYLVPTTSAAFDIQALVTQVLPVSFTVTKDQASTVTLQVLSPDLSSPIDFGYPSVAFSIVEYVRLMTCVQTLNPTTNTWQVIDANLTVNGVSYSHPAKTTTLRVAQADTYTLVFSKVGYATKTITLAAADIAAYQAAPLSVTLIPAVPVYRTVTFDSNGGTSVSPQSVIDNGFAAPPTDPTKPGYIFGGWYSDSELAVPFNFIATPITSDKTLYAKWTPAVTMITWNGGGSILIDGAYQTSPYIVPSNKTTMSVVISGASGGSSTSVGSSAEKRTFTSLPILQHSTYAVTIGKAGGNGQADSGGSMSGSGGGGASTIKVDGTYLAGAAGGRGGDGAEYGPHSSPIDAPGGEGGNGDSAGSPGESTDGYLGLGGAGGDGGAVNTGGAPVGGSVSGTATGEGTIVITLN